VPEVYGDPAIVLPRYYNPDVKKKFKIGVIPHYVDYKAVKEHLAEDTHVTIINLLTKSVEPTTREILECDHIISSSLHGVIVAQAYGVPALWIKFSDKLSGDNIKFYDYFESVGIDFNNEQRIDVNTLNYETMQHLLSTNKDVLLPEKDILIQLQDGLLKACPFKK